jgi:hypothetical protein
MTNLRNAQNNNDSYWKYLEENSKVVSTWPDWLKGDRPNTADQKQQEPEEPGEQELAS